MTTEKIKISEQFYSIQGEGRTMGVPAVFVRLQACNILCKGEWECDTIEVWKKGKEIKISHWAMWMSEYLKHFKNGAHLIFTGGEPLLQQKQIITCILNFIQLYGFKPYIEIETNGTIKPEKELVELVDLFNCSFKLKNSGVKINRRIKIDVLKKLNSYNTIFKIVVGGTDDYLEANTIFQEVGIEKKNIYLMPPADDIETLTDMNEMVAEICKNESVNFSTRLQIILWNKTTGV